MHIGYMNLNNQNSIDRKSWSCFLEFQSRIHTRLIQKMLARRLATTASKNVRFLSTTVARCKPATATSAEPTFKDLPNPRDLPRPDVKELHVPLYNPKEKYKEQSEELHKFGTYIMGCMPKFVQQFSVWKDELVVYCAPSGLVPLATFLRDHTSSQFKACMDVTAADYPNRTNRFDVVYDLLSVRFNSRIRIKTYTSEVRPVPSFVPLYPGTNWFERETYDMYGIFFEGHPDLRRIMTDYGFEGHPLRKDFPTTGYTEVRYDTEKRRVVYEPLELTQAWRNFTVGSSVYDQAGEGIDATPAEFKLPEPVLEEEVKDDKKK